MKFLMKTILLIFNKNIVNKIDTFKTVFRNGHFFSIINYVRKKDNKMK